MKFHLKRILIFTNYTNVSFTIMVRDQKWNRDIKIKFLRFIETVHYEYLQS